MDVLLIPCYRGLNSQTTLKCDPPESWLSIFYSVSYFGGKRGRERFNILVGLVCGLFNLLDQIKLLVLVGLIISFPSLSSDE